MHLLNQALKCFEQFQSLEFDTQPHMAYLHMLDLLVGCSVFKHSSLSWCCTALFSLLTALKAWLGECLSFTLQVGLIDVHVASSVLADVAAFAWPLLYLKLGAAFAGGEPGLLHRPPCLFCIASRCSTSTVDFWPAATQTGSLHTELRLSHNQLVKCQF